MEKEKQTHESFGQIQVSRINGTSKFYGSELEQDNYISIVVSNSEKESTLTSERYYPTKRLLELRMTAGQFSEMITSLNIGSGVPCTIEFAGRPIEGLPDLENRKEFVHRKFADRMKEFTTLLNKNQKESLAILNKKTLSVNDIKDLTRYIQNMSTEVTSNIPFFAKCFQETMDEVVFEAKLQVENAILHKINVLGLDALKKNNLLE